MKKFIIALLWCLLFSQAFAGSFSGPAYQPGNVTIQGGKIDNTVIGGTTPKAGSFTNIGVGTAAVTTSGVKIGATMTGATNASGVSAQATAQSDVTGSFSSFASTPSTAAAAFTVTNLRHYYAGPPVIGAGSSITNQYGFYVNAGMTGATNNYGFYSNLASAANVYGFYGGGTAASYFGGDVQIGSTLSLGATPGSGIMLMSPTAPTMGACGTSPSISMINGTAAFTVTIGTGGTATGCTVNFPAAPNMWACNVSNLFTGANKMMTAQASGNNAEVFSNYTVSTGVLTAFPASYQFQAVCIAH